MLTTCYALKPQYILLLLFFTFFSTNLFADQPGEALVNIDWLVKHYKDPNIQIVDARSATDFKKGHISGAVNIPVKDTFNPVLNTDRVGNLKHISALFSNAGIKKDHTVVIYDGNSYIDAGRVFWVFEVYGHKNVKLLDGGIKGWQAYSNLGLSQLLIKPKKSNYIPAIEPRRLITKLSMRLALETENTLIIDARSSAEYSGLESIAFRSGHIPNSVNIPWEENFIVTDGIKMLKPIEELKAMYDEKAKNKRVLLYCNKGKQSSLSYTILRQLGHNAAHYDGSWYEWGSDNNMPINSN